MSSKEPRPHLTFVKNICIIPETFGQIFCGLMRQKLNFLEGACPATSDIKPTHYLIKRTSYQQSNMVMVVVWCLGLRCSFRTWTTCHNWWNHEFCPQSENNEGECLAISLWPSSTSAFELCSRTMIPNTPATHLWMAQEKQNEGFGVAKSKSKLFRLH